MAYSLKVCRWKLGLGEFIFPVDLFQGLITLELEPPATKAHITEHPLREREQVLILDLHSSHLLLRLGFYSLHVFSLPPSPTSEYQKQANIF